jgi:gluconolactonase
MNTSLSVRNGSTLAAVLLAAAALTTDALAQPAERAEPMNVQPRPIGRIERLDPALDAIVDAAAEVEVIAQGLIWSEGPVWWQEGASLLFSDIPRNSVYRWKAGEGLTVFLKPSGYTGTGPRAGALASTQPPADVDEQGSNGLAIDAEGRLVLCQHGDRRIARLAEPLSVDQPPDPNYVTWADRWEGKRFNSPNDLALHKGGSVFFTDPPYGLEKGGDTTTREIEFNGVYRADPDGAVTLVSREMTKPNGIALSPDQKTLFVGQSDSNMPVWRAFEIQADGSLGPGRIFFNAKELVAKGLKGSPDGFKFDQSGNMLATGPGGVLVISPEGKHLGTISTGELISNCAFGDDGSTLYMTSHMYLCRVRLKTRGVGF